MDSYELLRPDGAGSGIWSCGQCHKAHLAAMRGNRKAAEACCAPRNCHYCGLVTERDSSGQFSWAHEQCIPKVEPVQRHASMANPYARLLYEKMSAISQDNLCAGWISGNEYALWEVLNGDPQEYGFGTVSSDDLEELRILSKHAEGWIWTGPDKEFTPRLVTFAEWESIRAAQGKVSKVDIS